MLGQRLPNNKIHIFFEKDEIEKLGNTPLQGWFYHYDDESVMLPLVASVEADIADLVETCTEVERGEVIDVHLKIHPEAYGPLRAEKKYGMHQGFRHVYLQDACRLQLSEQKQYIELVRRDALRVRGVL